MGESMEGIMASFLVPMGAADTATPPALHLFSSLYALAGVEGTRGTLAVDATPGVESDAEGTYR